MPTFGALLAPLALLLPAADAEEAPRSDAPAVDRVGLTLAPAEDRALPADIWLNTLSPNSGPVQWQIRIERRLIIRVSPRRPVTRQNLNAPTPRPQSETRTVEKKMGKCVKMQGIAGVQSTRDNRLMLYMQDQRIIAASLEKACSARDFYSGFYVEPSKDGNLCIRRDNLQTRTGVKCKLSELRQVVREPI
ncbi:hypothetical protein QWY75_02735 [Pontixanthobacter aestiaquae]|uniref:Uncharacterized protein n=1 Tax=Pontixanthobacter aestiaquae TaxID=1509367 RepID=A0A844ZAI5_9SPHN|nr:hypothetical protein [Pontixanthobacter aestiaquae]MDN3645120.1 hypothetical protein [Pontixanthobacter aestiaquae]MXO83880.1 hypothetical protein [Pontixanthobacter aestiaquae]